MLLWDFLVQPPPPFVTEGQMVLPPQEVTSNHHTSHSESLGSGLATWNATLESLLIHEYKIAFICDQEIELRTSVDWDAKYSLLE